MVLNLSILISTQENKNETLSTGEGNGRAASQYLLGDCVNEKSIVCPGICIGLCGNFGDNP